LPSVPTASSADQAWGGWLTLSQWVKDRTLEFLDDVDLYLNDINVIIGHLLELITFEVTPIDDIYQLVSDVITLGTAVIRANIDQTDVEEIACIGFCTMYEAPNYAFDEDVLDAWIVAADPGLNGDIGQHVIMETAERIKKSLLMQRYHLGLNNPDSDWQILCDCYEWIAPYGCQTFEPTNGCFVVTHGAYEADECGQTHIIRAANNGAGRLVAGFDFNPGRLVAYDPAYGNRAIESYFNWAQADCSSAVAGDPELYLRWQYWRAGVLQAERNYGPHHNNQYGWALARDDDRYFSWDKLHVQVDLNALAGGVLLLKPTGKLCIMAGT
jgi:hypothetical protein